MYNEISVQPRHSSHAWILGILCENKVDFGRSYALCDSMQQFIGTWFFLFSQVLYTSRLKDPDW